MPGLLIPTFDEQAMLAQLEAWRKLFVEQHESGKGPQMPTYLGDYVFIPLESGLPEQFPHKYFVMGPNVVGTIYEAPTNPPPADRMSFYYDVRCYLPVIHKMITDYLAK